MKWVVALIVLAVLTVGYGGAKTVQDFRAKRWLWSAVGLVVTIGAPVMLSVFAQLLAQYLRHSS
jgi:hypothetical protein